MNLVVLSGRLTKDFYISKFESSKQVAESSLAIKNEFNPDGEPTYVNLKGWGGKADVLAKQFQKGSRIEVEGYLEITRENGKTYPAVVIEKFHFIDSKAERAALNK